ncbi:hypothetical protein [Fulvimonas soli]|jgi:hypothetical protein|uniref:DUF4261 domain-containing protein n=1 Tax=Fulvimonas soli TaxID=155197 RepID=A0A316IHF6_9GAMM|nr:hypothetical protein [Fulvimonas soli]PWK92300.1 hypothetical protein C7456_10233 [Fulvimonas soli]TNY26905.1 hypothetical protein BV497_06250 [Fulvimonas soli]
MSEPAAAPEWPRPYWQQPGGNALLQFYVFGGFAPDLAIPAARYASAGLPRGVELKRFQNAVLRGWEGYPLAGALGEVLREESPEAYEAARRAPEALVIRGELADQASLDYLRDTLGVIAGLLDVGGGAVLDPQILSLFSAADWRRRYLVPGGAPPRSHVLILRREEAQSGRSRINTRGLRKFGRPDLDLRNVPDRDLDRAGLLCERLVELLALGADFAQGQALEVDGLPVPLVAERGGDAGDPEFGNAHVAFRWV